MYTIQTAFAGDTAEKMRARFAALKKNIRTWATGVYIASSPAIRQPPRARAWYVQDIRRRVLFSQTTHAYARGQGGGRYCAVCAMGEICQVGDLLSEQLRYARVQMRARAR